MARRGAVLPQLLLGTVLLAAVRSTLLAFVSPATPAAPVLRRASEPMASHVALQARGGARGGGPDVEAWMAEVATGTGGEPTGAIKEYILKWFWPAADPFTGPGKAPGKKDYKKVFEILKDCVAKGPAFQRGTSSAGFASVTGETSGVDGTPYSWLVGSMTPGGMFLFVTREFPGGKGVRPLVAFKIGEEEAMWSKINWNIVNKRLDITVGTNLEKVEGQKQR